MILRYNKNKLLHKCFVKFMLHIIIFLHDPYLKIQKIQCEKIYKNDGLTVDYVNYYVYIDTETKLDIKSSLFSLEAKERLCF